MRGPLPNSSMFSSPRLYVIICTNVLFPLIQELQFCLQMFTDDTDVTESDKVYEVTSPRRHCD